jgi:ParB family chromosome partitioning protein
MRRALGKGLSQLLGEQFEGGVQELPIDSIVPNRRQPRTVFDGPALDGLAESIREHGILQPLVVRPMTDGEFELIAGERRLRAAGLAGLSTVPVVIRSAGNQHALELALIENVQREDISALECARAYRKLADEFGMTQDAIARRVGKSRVAVSNTLRLLKLPPSVLAGLVEGTITEGHARALLGLASASDQPALFARIVTEQLSVRAVEQAVKTRTAPGIAPRRVRQRVSPFEAVERAASERLGTPVRVVPVGDGGRVEIKFFSLEDLDRIVQALGIEL